MVGLSRIRSKSPGDHREMVFELFSVLSKWDENAVIADGNASLSTRLDHSKSLLTRNNFYQYSQNRFPKKTVNYPNYWGTGSVRESTNDGGVANRNEHDATTRYTNRLTVHPMF